MEGGGRRRSVLIDAGVGVAVATAAFFLVGYLYNEVYYGSFGISTHTLGFSVADHMAASFLPLLAPTMLFVAALISVRFGSYVSTLKQKPKKAPSGMPWPFAGTACAVSALFVGWRLAALGDHTRRLFLGFSVADAVLLSFILIAIGAAAWRFRVDPLGPAGRLNGPKPRSIFLSMLAVVMLLVAGMLSAADRANDQAWGCVARPFIDFEPLPAGLNESHDYWLIIQTESHYFVRDNDTPARAPDYIAVESKAIETAHTHHQAPNEDDCSGTRWPF